MKNWLRYWIVVFLSMVIFAVAVRADVPATIPEGPVPAEDVDADVAKLAQSLNGTMKLMLNQGQPVEITKEEFIQDTAVLLLLLKDRMTQRHAKFNKDDQDLIRWAVERIRFTYEKSGITVGE